MKLVNLTVTNPNLTNSAIIVYMLLCRLAESGGKNNREVTISCLDLAKIRQMSDKTVRTSLRQLIDEGVITAVYHGNQATTYYLVEIDEPEPPKPRKRRRKAHKPDNTAVSSTANQNNSLNNNINISEYQISDISKTKDIFSAAEIAELPQDKVEAVRAVYSQLRDWRGSKPLYIGYRNGHKIAYLPEAVRIQMSRLTAAQLRSVILLYDPTKVQGSGKAWIQAALMRPITMSQPSTTCLTEAAKKRNSVHFELERAYDFKVIEAAAMARQCALAQ